MKKIQEFKVTSSKVTNGDTRVTGFQQLSDWDCGCAAVVVALTKLGLKVPTYAQLMRELLTSPDFGTHPDAIQLYLERRGLQVPKPVVNADEGTQPKPPKITNSIILVSSDRFFDDPVYRKDYGHYVYVGDGDSVSCSVFDVYTGHWMKEKVKRIEKSMKYVKVGRRRYDNVVFNLVDSQPAKPGESK